MLVQLVEIVVYVFKLRTVYKVWLLICQVFLKEFCPLNTVSLSFISLNYFQPSNFTLAHFVELNFSSYVTFILCFLKRLLNIFIQRFCKFMQRYHLFISPASKTGSDVWRLILKLVIRQIALYVTNTWFLFCVIFCEVYPIYFKADLVRAIFTDYWT